MNFILFDPSDATAALDGLQIKTNVQKSDRSNEARYPTGLCAASLFPHHHSYLRKSFLFPLSPHCMSSIAHS